MNKKKILEIMKNNNGIISNKESIKYGISRTALHRLKEEGEIYSISRGLYSLNDEIPDTMLVIQHRCKKGIFSHESALYFHELTNRTPSQHVMTVPASYNTTSMKDLPVKFRYVKLNFIEIGKKIMNTNQGNKIYMYDIERTICDLIRNKANMDVGIVNNALRQYANSNKSKYSLLMIYAKKLGIDKKVRNAMAVLF